MANGKEIGPGDVLPGGESLLPDLLTEELTLEEYNRRIIFHTLKKCDNNVVEAARRLGIGKSTIYRLLKEAEP
jgi:DNA-binding NtrC family response regulator